MWSKPVTAFLHGLCFSTCLRGPALTFLNDELVSILSQQQNLTRTEALGSFISPNVWIRKQSRISFQVAVSPHLHHCSSKIPLLSSEFKYIPATCFVTFSGHCSENYLKLYLNESLYFSYHNFFPLKFLSTYLVGVRHMLNNFISP